MEIKAMEMEYLKIGNGSKTMVILPGFSLRPISDDPAPIIDSHQIFVDEFTVYLIDRRSDIEEGYTLYQMAEDTVTKLKELGLKDIYLYGISQGGMLAQLIAINRPELIKKMVLASTTGRSKNISLDLETIFEAIKDYDVTKIVDTFCSSIYSKEFYAKYRRYYVSTFSDLTEEELHHFEIIAKSIDEFDNYAELEKVNIPTLVLGSKKDKIIDYHEMEELAKALRGEIYLYDEYDHGVNVEASDFKQRIKTFFMGV